MIHFIIATFPEAKSFIKFYKLKKLLSLTEFETYINKRKKITLTISGIGKLLSACSVVFTNSYFKNKNNIWINIGLGGIKNTNIGKLYLINKIIDKENDLKFYPFFLFKTNIEKKQCKTFNKPNFSYSNSVHDMEVSGFYLACTKFSTNELIHSFKIISDNKNKRINFKNIDEVSSLMEKNIEKIDKFIYKLKDKAEV